MIDSDAGEVFPIRRNLVNLFLHSSLNEKGWEIWLRENRFWSC